MPFIANNECNSWTCSARALRERGTGEGGKGMVTTGGGMVSCQTCALYGAMTPMSLGATPSSSSICTCET